MFTAAAAAAESWWCGSERGRRLRGKGPGRFQQATGDRIFVGQKLARDPLHLASKVVAK